MARREEARDATASAAGPSRGDPGTHRGREEGGRIDQRTREENRRKLAETEKRDASE